MPDHINIQHPDYRGLHTFEYCQILENKKLKAELDQLTQWHRAVCSDLESIFNRIEDGQVVELHYKDGRVFVITGKQRE
jgi:hypothetical protein